MENDMDDSAILKMLSVRAVQEFEEMKAKCTEYHGKYVQDRKRVQKLEFQFKQLKRASLLAVSEYEILHKSYTAEVASRQDLETRLAKVDAENKHLRKANDYAPTTMIMRDQAENAGGKGELEGLRGLVTGMKDELRRAKEEITNLREDLKSEQVSHEATQKKYRVSQEHVKQLSSVSIMALEEYQELKRKHEIELECRAKAEEYASEMVREKAIIDRKSKWFSEHTDNDETLKAALDDVDRVTREADEQKRALDAKIKELEEELEMARDPQAVKDAESKLNLALDQVDLVQSQLSDAERRVGVVEMENRSLHTRLEAASVGIYIPAPPPPPTPPALPPLPGSAIRNFISKVGGKKKKVTGQPAQDDPRADAMQEMIARIKNGNVKLRSTRAEAKKDDSAMGELASMLSNLKRGGPGSQDSLDMVETEEKQPEFQVVKLKKVVKKEPLNDKDEDKNSEVGELKKILERKRSAANAISEKVPPTVAPKSDKVALLKKGASVTDGSPLEARRASQPSRAALSPDTEVKAGRSISLASSADPQSEYKVPKTPVRTQPDGGEATASFANNQPSNSSPEHDSSAGSITSNDVPASNERLTDDSPAAEVVPMRPPRTKSSLNPDSKPKRVSSSTGERDSSDSPTTLDTPRKESLPSQAESSPSVVGKEEPPPQIEGAPAGSIEHASQDKTEPKAATNEPAEPTPAPTAEDIQAASAPTDASNGEPLSKAADTNPDEDLTAAIDDLDKLMSEFGA